MKIKILEDKKIIISNPGSMHNYFGWPTIEKLRDNRIAVSASGFRIAHLCPFGKAVMAVSADEGKSFSAPQVVIDTPLDDRDAGLCAFGKSGLIVTSFNNTRAAQRGWTTFVHYNKKKPEKIVNYINAYLDNVTDEQEEKYLGSTFRVSFDNGTTFGDIYKSPVTSPHGPIELLDGSILWVGQTFNKTGTGIMKKDSICATKLCVNTGKVEIIGEIENIEIDGIRALSCEPYAIQLPDGKIVCHIRVEIDNVNKKIFTVFQSESLDGGITWTKPKQLLDNLGGSPAHLMLHSSGTLLSLYGYRERPFGIKAMASVDGANSWDIDNVVCEHNVHEDLGYPTSVELSDGSIYTVFYARPKEDESASIYGIRWSFEL